MIRNLKVLGLALVAVLAMGVVASVASAQNGLLTSDGPVTLVALQTGFLPQDNSLTTFSGTDVTTCPEAGYTGHKSVTTPHALIPSGASETTITPHYGKCTWNGLPATIDMNGCDYSFDLRTTVEAEVYRVTATLHCPVGKHIQVTAFTGASHIIRACTITVTEKTDYEGLQARDTTNGYVDITGTISGIEVHESKEFGCNHPGQTSLDGVMHVDLTLLGKNSKGEATSIGISHF